MAEVVGAHPRVGEEAGGPDPGGDGQLYESHRVEEGGAPEMRSFTIQLATTNALCTVQDSLQKSVF